MTGLIKSKGWEQDGHHQTTLGMVVQADLPAVGLDDVAGDAQGLDWLLSDSPERHGKRGGVRLIYFNLSAEELVLLVHVYAKADRANLAANEIDRS